MKLLQARAVICVIALLSLATGAFCPLRAQSKPDPHPKIAADAVAPNGGMVITELERLTLDNAQKDAIIQQQQSQAIQMQIRALQAQQPVIDAALQAALKTLNERAAKVKEDHNWGDDVTFNQAFDAQHPAFVRAPKPATPPAADAKTPEAKKP